MLLFPNSLPFVIVDTEPGKGDFDEFGELPMANEGIV